MELIFRQRLDRPDKLGRCAVFGDLHWLGGHRWKMPTGVKVLPAHWHPTKTKRIATGATNANALNLRLTKLQNAVQGVFLKAEAAERPEGSVTTAELQLAVIEAGAGSKRMAVPAPVLADPHAPLADTTPWQVLHDRWQTDNKGRVSVSAMKGFQQVVNKLQEYDSALRIGAVTKERLNQYTAWLHEQGYKDGTVDRHYWFLRECCQLTGRVAPKWMNLTGIRYGRSLSLLRAEVQLLATVALPPTLARERDVFLFQLLLLLRDSDLRALRPHHVRQHELPGWGLQWCVELYQDKTGNPVLLPLPPLAASIWHGYQGQLPVHSNWTRNAAIRRVGQEAGLNREYVSVAFSGRTKHEHVMPVWEALHTHSARHTGAALLIWASDGDQTLKECALGHVSESVYGYDTVERYGPRLLDAWQRIFTEVPQDRGQVFENRGQVAEMPPVLLENGARRGRVSPVKSAA